MTRAHVMLLIPCFPIQCSEKARREMSLYCRFWSCLILLFIITLQALLAKCNLYINNTRDVRSPRMCLFFFFEVICVSHNFIF